MLTGAVELQVRSVEEPYLQSSMPGWRQYAAKVGRFVPRLGRIYGDLTNDTSPAPGAQFAESDATRHQTRSVGPGT